MSLVYIVEIDVVGLETFQAPFHIGHDRGATQPQIVGSPLAIASESHLGRNDELAPDVWLLSVCLT